jgi:choline dehydrogenase-like flavoprotein
LESTKVFDIAILGSGLSGSIWANYCVNKQLETCVIEAGNYYKNPKEYPRGEAKTNSQMYWNGGAELNTTANLGFLRPKVVGGGSVVNQALLDRFDEQVFSEWNQITQLDFYKTFEINKYYSLAESKIKTKTFSSSDTNLNAKNFIKGCEKNNFQWTYLKRAESHCQGNDCIECLSGCRKGSKQSADRVYFDSIANSPYLKLLTRSQVLSFEKSANHYKVFYQDSRGNVLSIQAKKIVLAMGSVGNSLFLLNSKIHKTIPRVGDNFYTHPQFMMLGIYPEKIHSELGSFQTVKSQDAAFRSKGFKLENVFAQPVGLAMLIPEIQARHRSYMNQITHMSCIEVAIKDTHPGRISVLNPLRAKIEKKLDKKDATKKEEGLKVIQSIFLESGATKTLEGKFGIGLHLMGGCSLGSNIMNSVFNLDFELWNHKGIYCSDSSLFPAASGINPSLTIMALTHAAAHRVLNL